MCLDFVTDDVPLQGASTEWTNEKHNLYLDSLETSFVNELYHSMRLRDWHQQKNARGTRSLQEVSFKTQNSSDQVRVKSAISLLVVCEHVGNGPFWSSRSLFSWVIRSSRLFKMAACRRSNFEGMKVSWKAQLILMLL